MTVAPVIGVTTSDRKSKIAWFFDWFAVRRAGGVPVRISPSRRIPYDELDGLIIGGGDDIGVELYGGELTLDVRVDPKRDELELSLLKRAISDRLPVLGICRGAQMINVHMAGTLHSDIKQAFDGIRNIRTVLPRKRVDIKENSGLRRILRLSSCRVNSLHHQAVDRLGHGLQVVAKDRYGIIQAIENTDFPFLIGVQWHPEFLIFNRAQQRLFRTLVRTALQRQTQTAAQPMTERLKEHSV